MLESFIWKDDIVDCKYYCIELTLKAILFTRFLDEAMQAMREELINIAPVALISSKSGSPTVTGEKYTFQVVVPGHSGKRVSAITGASCIKA